MPTEYITRQITPSVDQAITQKFDQKLRGHTSPRQKWSRALFFIGALETERSIAAYTLWQRALQVADSRRNEIELRDEVSVQERYEQERAQLQDVLQGYQQGSALLVDVANRLSNVLYYTVQRYAHDGNIAAFNRDCDEVCRLCDLPPDIAFRLAMEKYESRARRSIKDVADEYRRMQRVLDQFFRDREIASRTA